ncbi:MAG: hypothetical protein J6I46_01175 [Ruminococcus sp.]|nr:hypothetical protein [Ruminococcus sp.]MBP3796371.1 hypothetical protein [Ruminococcus sp.]
MNKSEINIFIAEMKHIGDFWEPTDVERVYGDKTLDEALADRKEALVEQAEIFNIIANR